MQGFDVLWGTAIALLLGFQVWLTTRIWKNDAYDRDQRVAQTKLIWLVPIAGALLVSVVMWHMRDEHKGTRR